LGRVRAYIGLGANIGDAADTLAAAIHTLAALPGVRLAGVSRLYATAPVGVTDQPEFRNAVVALDVPSGPDPVTGALALLVAL
jgi:2-amino-4-hydroxy-6-hydroxymethyldihydropteridine diphosphokinase